MKNAARIATLMLSLATMPAAAEPSTIWPDMCRDEWHMTAGKRTNILLCRMDNGAVYYSRQDRKTGRTTAPRLDNGE